MLNAVILHPLPFPEPDRLVSLYNVYPGVGVTDNGANGVPDYLDRKQMTDVFDSVCLVGNDGYAVGDAGSPQRVSNEYVTPSYFRVLRVAPMMGRAFTEDDAVLGKEKSVILSYGLWKDMFAKDPNILGKDMRLSSVPYKIIGVMPESFEQLDRDRKFWVPFAFTPEQTSDDARHSNSWAMFARLKPGVTVGQAQQRIDALNKSNLDRFPKYRKLLEDARFGTKVVGLQDLLIRDIRPTLYLLQAAVAFVLLIGCVNVANLMLVRSNIRMKEMAIRFSLGAGRWRLARQLLTESVTIAALGGLLGLVVGSAGIRMLMYLGAKELPRGENIQMDGAVLAYSAALAVLTGLVFGSVPVFHLYRRDLNEVFRQTGRTGTTERGALWTRSALVVCQVSLAFVLLIGSALLTLSFARLLSVDPGFKPQNVLSAQFTLPDVRYKEDARARNFVATMLESVRALPGVTRAGATTYLPFSGNNNASVVMIDGYNRAPGELPPVPGWNTVDSGYFQAMGIPLLQGRTFSESDTADAQKVVVIDQFLARKYWPKGDAIGARIRRGIERHRAALHDHRRGGQRENCQSRRPESGRASLFSLQAVRAARDALGGQNQWREPAADVHDSPPDSAGRPGNAAVRYQDHAGARFEIRGEPPRGHDSVPGVRRAGAGAIRDRHLRRAGVHRDAAHAGIGNPRGAGRRSGRRDRHGAGARPQIGRDRPGHRDRGRARAYAPDDHVALRREADRSRRILIRRGCLGGGGCDCVADSVAAGRAHPAGNRAQIRIAPLIFEPAATRRTRGLRISPRLHALP